MDKPGSDASKMDWRPLLPGAPPRRTTNWTALQSSSDSSAAIAPPKQGSRMDWLPVYSDIVMPRIVNLAGASSAVSSGAARLAGTATLVHSVPDLLVQAVINHVGKTTDGDLVVCVCPAFDAIVRLLEQDPSALFKIDPRKLEEIVAASYEKSGYQEVILTPRSGDLGRDVVATKTGLATIRIVDQVKAFAADQVVSAHDVRALVGVLAADVAANKGYVTTSAEFAPRIESDRLLAPLMPTRLELINGRALRERLTRIRLGEKA